MRMRFPYRRTKAARGPQMARLAGTARLVLLTAPAAVRPCRWSGFSFPPPPNVRIPLIYCYAATITWHPGLPWPPSALLLLTKRAQFWNQTRRALKHAALRPPAADAWLRCMMTWPVTHLISGSGGLWSSRPFGGPSDHGRERG